MDQPMTDLKFKMMAMSFKLRDMFLPRAEFLQELDIKPGSRVLDFGCGTGSYSLVAAEMVGSVGKVYALDIQPLAFDYLQDEAFQKGLTNIETIRSDCATRLPDACVDFAFLFDIFHILDYPEKILAELQRVLKPDGLLCVNDHHMQVKDIIMRISLGGRFKLNDPGNRIITFRKILNPIENN